MVHKREVALVVDSSCCLPQELLDQWQIHTVPHELVIDGRSLRDGIDIGPTEFYQLLGKNNQVPTTSCPKPASFLELFRLASTVANNVLCITLSANFSSTYDSATTTARIAEEELPGFHVRVVDSQAAAGAEGLIVLAASRAASRGAGLEEVTSVVSRLIPKVSLLAFPDTLDYLRKSGRVPRIAAWAGLVLGIKPLAELKLGQARVIEKPRSRARAIQRLADLMMERVQQRPVHVNVMHANAAADAHQLRQQVDTYFTCRELFVSEFTPVMGAHLGPGLLGLAFFTDD